MHILPIFVLTLALSFAFILFIQMGAEDPEASIRNDGVCRPDLNWTLDTNSGDLSITGNGPMYNYDYYDARWGNMFSLSNPINWLLLERIAHNNWHRCGPLRFLTQCTSHLIEITTSASPFRIIMYIHGLAPSRKIL